MTRRGTKPARATGMTTERLLAGRYAIEAVLGFGGMGIVYAATDTILERPVALKTIHPQVVGQPSAWRRFQREAAILCTVSSPHVPRLHAARLTRPKDALIVIERLHGSSLEQHLAEAGPLAVGEAAHYVAMACRALSHVHALGLVHRDVKLSNLVIAREPGDACRLKLIDFGIACQSSGAEAARPLVEDLRRESGEPWLTSARERVRRAFDRDSRITRADESVGSPCYQAPEQMLDPGCVDRRADVWSLGVLLFELVTGVNPFDGVSLDDACRRVLERPLPRIGDHRADVPASFARVVDRCLERRREARIPSVDELEDALAPFRWRRCDPPRCGPRSRLRTEASRGQSLFGSAGRAGEFADQALSTHPARRECLDSRAP